MACRRSWAGAVVFAFEALVVEGAGCGGRTDPGLDDQSAQEPAFRPVLGSSAPLWVPPGLVWLGLFTINPVTKTAGVLPCPPGKGYGEPLPSAPYLIPGFFLDADETTVEVYEHCVEAGACDSRPPAPATPTDFPVSLDRLRASQWCAWRGGEIPSLAQMRRAEMGDLEASLPAPSVLLWAWVDCLNAGFVGSACEKLARRVPVDHPIDPIRSDPMDVGPYGHYDLFGSQWELTTTTLYTEPQGVALEARNKIDCAQQGLALPDLTKGSTHVLHATAASLRAINPQQSYDMPVGITQEPLFESPALWGARCAYRSKGNNE